MANDEKKELTKEQNKEAERELRKSDVGDHPIYTMLETEGDLETYYDEIDFPSTTADFDTMMTYLDSMSTDLTEKRGERTRISLVLLQLDQPQVGQ